MARNCEKLAAQKDRRQRSVQKDQGKHPQGVKKAIVQRSFRRSARLNPKCSEHAEHQHPLPSNETLCKEGRLTALPSKDRKLSPEVENLLDANLTAPLRRRPRASPGLAVEKSDRRKSISTGQQPSRSRRLPPQQNRRLQDEVPSQQRKPQQDTRYPVRNESLSAPLNCRKRRREEHPTATEPPQKRFQPHPEQTAEPEIASRISGSQSSYIAHWVMEKTWPREDLELGFSQLDNMLLARKKSASLRRKRSESSIASATPSEKPRETKTVVYAHRSYPTWLKTQGVYMERSELGISDDSKRLCRSLLETKCNTPKDSLFRDDIFEEAIDDLQDKNESRIIQDIARLLVPSVRTLARVSEKHLGVLVESVNEGWENCIPLIDPRPQPDYAVGFGRSGLSDSRIRKLRPLLGDDPSYQSPLMATHYMYFPILTSEVKCGTTGLELADRQNAQSMGIAVRAIVSIFQRAKRESELHRELLTFSVSHDHRTVRLHGWYPIFKGNKFTVHRHLIHAFDVIALEAQEKWTAFRFSRGVYERAIILLEKINTIVDELPSDLNLGDFQPPGSQLSEPSGLSQQFEEQLLSEETVDIQQVTPDPSMQEMQASKKKKKG
ncbi:hypothetical protein K469DRAFT_69192 [Zopfia rhizophila CBS 207.26]|uniref:DUF7924 domain-containing protein n=1 Tax=Zopfia rhizophila CBS 207.26 TaxID=1314779 RepID=A0A6A6DCG7_9PEZI|nr:hypothetical protein K469DRAFT_69192 [Zopfia rhizophila CBS 207.26]